MMKIAIISNDGEHVNAPYEKAETVYVYLVKGNKADFMEKRRAQFFHGKESKRMFKGHSFERVYETIKDCDMLCANKIGEIPAQRFRMLGIDVEEFQGRMSDFFTNIGISTNHGNILNKRSATVKKSAYSDL